LSLIEKVGILENQIEFLPSHLIKIMDKIARKLKFGDQLRVRINLCDFVLLLFIG
jgi:hypothetical protein